LRAASPSNRRSPKLYLEGFEKSKLKEVAAATWWDKKKTGRMKMQAARKMRAVALSSAIAWMY
jgi:hypothetical protein